MNIMIPFSAPRVDCNKAKVRRRKDLLIVLKIKEQVQMRNYRSILHKYSRDKRITTSDILNIDVNLFSLKLRVQYYKWRINSCNIMSKSFFSEPGEGTQTGIRLWMMLQSSAIRDDCRKSCVMCVHEPESGHLIMWWQIVFSLSYTLIHHQPEKLSWNNFR